MPVLAARIDSRDTCPALGDRPGVVGGARVLVVAAGPEHWSPVGKALANAGYCVLIASEIAAAREICSHGVVDLVLIATSGPDHRWRRDATALLQRLRALPGGTSLPVLALDPGADDPWKAAELRALGFDDVAASPSEPRMQPMTPQPRLPAVRTLPSVALAFAGGATAVVRDGVERARSRRFALALALLAGIGLTYGLVPSLTRIGALDHVSLFVMNCLANALAALVLAAAAVIGRERLQIDRRALVFFAAAGLLHLLAQLFLFHASAHLPASTVSAVLVCEGFMSFVIAAVARIEAARWSRLIGLALGFAGLIVLVNWGETSPGTDAWTSATAIAAALGVPLAFALEGVLWAACRPARTGLCATNAVIFGLSAVAMAPLAAIEGGASLGSGASLLTHLGIIGLVGACFAAGNLMFMHLVARSGPVFASQNAYSIMLFGIAWGVLLLGEEISDWATVAILLVVAGLALVGQRGETDDRPAEFKSYAR